MLKIMFCKSCNRDFEVDSETATAFVEKKSDGQVQYHDGRSCFDVSDMYTEIPATVSPVLRRKLLVSRAEVLKQQGETK